MSDDNELAQYLKDGLYDTGQIRNPARISEVLHYIENEWREHPDMRLGQLISVLSGRQDVFGVEDTKLVSELDEDLDCGYWTNKDE